MRLLRLEPASLFARILGLAACAGLASLALLDRGATHAYAGLWALVRIAVLAAPLAALALRSVSRDDPLRLPARPWLAAASLFAGGALLSSLLSPYRGTSLGEALTPLAMTAAFLLLFDRLHADSSAGPRLLRVAGAITAAVVLLSVAGWIAFNPALAETPRRVAALFAHRNDRPFGHSNYTAGFALLVLPWFVTWVRQSRGPARFGAAALALVALLMLFSSGSRGGLLGLGALALATLALARIGWRRRALAVGLTVIAALALALAHPRTREMLFSRPTPNAIPNISNVQRTAMLTAGLRMGSDRPLLGWGAGTTPLVFPRYRGGLDGGAENVLQLHSTPVQLWADGGILALASAALFVVLALRGARRHPTAFASLAGYGVFALTDYQLDLPVFSAAIALGAALLAPPPADPAATTSPLARRIAGFASIGALLLVAVLGRRDPTPALDVRALALAAQPAGEERAIALLRDSLALNPDQEIAHFNLGWLLVLREPAEAGRHFLAAARLVPDKGGVYLGLALARLNQDQPAAAARALALECLDDPMFLTSPWWREPRVAALRSAMRAALQRDAAIATKYFSARSDDRRLRELRYVVALARWLDGVAGPGEVLGEAHTSERVSYFAARPAPPDFWNGEVRVYRRERTGFPVLMRMPDLPAPLDVAPVQESAQAAGSMSFLFPAKGWLPGPLLLALLEPVDSSGS